MKRTTAEIIKILPFEDKFKIDLINKLPTLTPDQKFVIEQVVWDFYDVVYEIRLQHNLEEAILEQDTNQPSDPDLLKKMRDKTEEEMKKDFEVKTTQVDISAIRSKLQVLMNEKKIN